MRGAGVVLALLAASVVAAAWVAGAPYTRATTPYPTRWAEDLRPQPAWRGLRRGIRDARSALVLAVANPLPHLGRLRGAVV